MASFGKAARKRPLFTVVERAAVLCGPADAHLVARIEAPRTETVARLDDEVAVAGD